MRGTWGAILLGVCVGLWSYLGVWGIVLRVCLGWLAPWGLVELSSGTRRYELSDWLGNVRVVVTDQDLPIYKGKKLVEYRVEVVGVRDYYRYGLDISERSYGSPIHPSRYSYSGKEDLREKRW